MLVTVTPASTKTGTAVIRSLVAASDAGVEIQAMYRDTTRAPAEFTSLPNFTAVREDIADESSLNFRGSDVVVAIRPPVFDGGDIVAIAKERSENVKKAIERSGTVKKVVLLSSIGAQFSSGVGEIKTNNMAERVFAKTRIPEIVFIRCAYFMENWTMALDTLGGPEAFFFSTITPLEWKLPMVAVADVGVVIACQALKRVFPECIVPEWVEMTTSFLPGGVMKPGDVDEGAWMVNGKTELGDAVKTAVRSLR